VYEENSVLAIKSIIEENFPAYSFVDHQILFNYKIPAEAAESNLFEPASTTVSSYPIYSFLFNGLYLLENLIVLS